MKRFPKIGQRVVAFSTEGSFTGTVVEIHEVALGLVIETGYLGTKFRKTVPLSCVSSERKERYV